MVVNYIYMSICLHTSYTSPLPCCCSASFSLDLLERNNAGFCLRTRRGGESHRVWPHKDRADKLEETDITTELIEKKSYPEIFSSMFVT